MTDNRTGPVLSLAKEIRAPKKPDRTIQHKARLLRKTAQIHFEGIIDVKIERLIARVVSGRAVSDLYSSARVILGKVNGPNKSWSCLRAGFRWHLVNWKFAPNNVKLPRYGRNGVCFPHKSPSRTVNEFKLVVANFFCRNLTQRLQIRVGDFIAIVGRKHFWKPLRAGCIFRAYGLRYSRHNNSLRLVIHTYRTIAVGKGSSHEFRCISQLWLFSR